MQLKNWWRVILGIIVLTILIRVGYMLDGTGFGNKTLWDWMQLLIVPSALAVGGYWLKESVHQREREAEEQQTSFDKIIELLKELDSKKEKDIKITAMEREQILTPLQRLNGDNKGKLLQFLYKADLIDKNKKFIYLKNADFSGAKLSGAHLRKTYLKRANLSRADLSEARLSEAYLEKANLIGANLSRARLRDVDLSEANLSEANLGRADLSGANLSGADLSEANLSEADLSNAILSGAKYTKNAKDIRDTIWPDGFDPAAAGAICVNE